MTLPSKCLNCDVELSIPIVCGGCHTLYPIPQTANYFDLLGLPQQFDLDGEKLSDTYRAIARNIHPDRFAGQATEMDLLATKLSAQVNEAWRVLKDPVRRAEYLLELANGPSAADCREVPGDLLARVMMLREDLEEARDQSDEQTLTSLRCSIQDERDHAFDNIAKRANDLSLANDTEKKAFRQLLNSIKYFDSLLADFASDPLSQGNPQQ